MIRGITCTHIQSVWNHSGPSEVPLFRKPGTGQEFFLAVSYSKPALARHSGVRRSAKNVVGAGQSTQWDEIFFDLEDLEDFFDVISPREEKS